MLRVLLAEGEAIKCIVLHMLRQLGYHVDVVNNGVEALQALERDTYDVIQMPDMDGFDVTRRICSSRRPPRIILSLTAHTLAVDRERRSPQG